MIYRLATLLLAVIATPAAAQTAADAPATPKPEKKLCRTIDTTGSIMGGTKTCHTKAEWAAIDQTNNDRVRAGRDVAGQGGNHQGGGF